MSESHALGRASWPFVVSCLFLTAPGPPLSAQAAGSVETSVLASADSAWQPSVPGASAPWRSPDSWPVPAGVVTPDAGPRTDALGLQLMGGIVGGLAGAALISGALLVPTIGQEDDGWGKLTAIGIGVVVGYPLGAAGGVYWAGRSRDLTGSVLGTLAGTAVGAAVGMALLDSTDGISFVVMIPAGAVAGFHLVDLLRASSG